MNLSAKQRQQENLNKQAAFEDSSKKEIEKLRKIISGLEEQSSRSEEKLQKVLSILKGKNSQREQDSSLLVK